MRTLVVVTLTAGVAFAGGLAVAGGYGPVPDAGLPQPSTSGGDDAGLSDEEFPTATPTPTPDDGDGSSGGDGDATTATPTAEPAPFDVSIVDVAECGDTCRDVTVDLTNQQETDATGVTVYTRIFAGNSTDEGDQVWSGEEDVGTLPAGETYTATKTVDLSLSEALAVDQADGWITVQTTIETDDQTLTFTERRQVA